MLPFLWFSSTLVKKTESFKLIIQSVTTLFYLGNCPGFSWDRANFHNKLVGLTQTANPVGCSIPCDVTLSV